MSAVLVVRLVSAEATVGNATPPATQEVAEVVLRVS